MLVYQRVEHAAAARDVGDPVSGLDGLMDAILAEGDFALGR